MTSKEFIEMQRQDVETHENKGMLLEVVAAMEEVLRGDESAGIGAEKTAEECYNKMREYARDNAKGGAYCFTPTAAKKFIAEYLGVAAADEPKAEQRAKKRHSLEEFF